MNNVKEYWSDIDNRLKNLIENGYVKLQSLKAFELEHVAESISNEMKSLTFKELGTNHKMFLNTLELDKYLIPKLFAEPIPKFSLVRKQVTFLYLFSK